MLSLIRYQCLKIFNRNLSISFVLITIVSLYLTSQGISGCKNFAEYKKDFLIAENDRVNFYLNYEQYGIFGFRIILEPSPLSVFFNSSDFTRNIEARIDTSEIISLYNERKGKRAFSMDSRFGDMNQSITFFGTLIMMMVGFLSFPNQYHIEYFKNNYYIKSILIRIILLNIFFALLLIINYSFANAMGITFLAKDNQCFIIYGLTTLLLLDIFFLSSVFIKSLCKYNKNALLFIFITWFIVIFAIPEMGKVYRSIKTNALPSEEKLAREKLKTLWDNERNNRKIILDFLSKHPNDNSLSLKNQSPEFQKLMKMLFLNYMNDDYLQNKKKEEDFFRLVKHDMDIFSFLDTLYPIDFLKYVSAEVSGKGPTAYLEFFKYVINLKDQFMQFYGQMRYETPAKVRQNGIDSFIKDSENIYQSESRLPKNFLIGVVIILIYIVILSGGIYYSKRKKKNKLESFDLAEDIILGQILFLLVNKKKQEEIVNTLKQKDRPNLHPNSHLILNEDVKAKVFLDYACHEKKLKKHKVLENLELFAFQEKDLRKNLAKFSEENKKKLICSLVFAEPNNVIIINDFIKGASFGFEKQFLNLVSQEVNSGRKIIYIGNEIYTPSSSFIKSNIRVETYQAFHLDPQRVSLR